MYRYITIQPNGLITSWVEKKAPDWKEIQKYVEGPFQIVPYFSKYEMLDTMYNRGTAYVNENGRITDMAHNPTATQGWMKACPKGDPDRMKIYGPLLFVAKEKSNGKTS